jgi:hypothetical protein
MADDIKIQVGVKSTVREDMRKLSQDMLDGISGMKTTGKSLPLEETMRRGAEAAKKVQAESMEQARKAELESAVQAIRNSKEGQAREFKKNTEEFERLYGASGKKSAEKFISGFSGSGFRGALTNLMRGDVSAALEALSSGTASKAAIWGGGILTAFFSGWKMGKWIDEVTGFSDKLSKALFKPVEAGIDAATKAIRQYRADVVKEQEEIAKAQNFQSSLTGIRDERGAIGGGAIERLTIEQKKMLQLQSEMREEGLSIEEQRKRQLAYEQQINAVSEAGLALEKEDEAALIEANKKEIALQETNAKLAKTLAEESAAAKKTAYKDTQEFLAWGNKQAANAEIDNIKKVADAEEKAADERRKALQEKIKLGEQGAADADIAADGGSWRAQKNKGKDEERERKRRERMLKTAREMLEKGITLPDRMMDQLAAEGKKIIGRQAQKDLERLDAELKKKQMKQADDIALLLAATEAENKKLDQLLTMK